MSTSYPIFEKAAASCKQKYWKDKMIDASNGFFQDSKISFDGTRLKYEGGTSVEIPQKPYTKVIRSFIEFHEKNLTPKHKNELALEEVQSMYRVETVLEWDTTPNKIRAGLLETYLNELTVLMYPDNCSKQDDLYSILMPLLYNALQLGLLTSNVVRMKRNKITRISILKYDEDNDEWSIVYK